MAPKTRSLPPLNREVLVNVVLGHAERVKAEQNREQDLARHFLQSVRNMATHMEAAIEQGAVDTALTELEHTISRLQAGLDGARRSRRDAHEANTWLHVLARMYGMHPVDLIAWAKEQPRGV